MYNNNNKKVRWPHTPQKRKAERVYPDWFYADYNSIIFLKAGLAI